ncbi:MAG: hypothetical protein ACON5H_04965 [Akkermansiaceae bacterium]
MNRLISLSLLAFSPYSQANTVGHWRFDESAAAAGASLTLAENKVSPGTIDASPNGGNPLYSDDVPYAEIFDPVSGQTYSNGFSLDASGASASLITPDSIDFNSSFTVEFFVKILGEPLSYETILDRQEANDLTWKIDFDHAANLGFGRMRARWDTPAGGTPNGVAENGVDENWNFVLGPQGNANAPKVYIDTGAKDAGGADVGPQNSGIASDYVYDAASANPNDVDVALQGDGNNDVPEWHHVAMSFDEATGEIRFYFDYALSQTRTLSDSEANGYTHPRAGLRFGKILANEYGLLLDELRYSNEVLSSTKFLRQPPTGGAGNTIGHWRMDDDGASDGADIVTVSNEVSPLLAALRNAGTPRYSSDVPAPQIYDPVSDVTFANNFSLDATEPNSRLRIDDDEAFNTSFTLEYFIKLSEEPGGYHAFVRRSQANDLRWQIDFDHGSKSGFGRLRSRFDTPGPGGSDGVNEAGVDENINFVVGPTGFANIPDPFRLWIDTDAGDGVAASYDDPSDWANDGDGINDNDVWHHSAITFNEETGALRFYYDYELLQSRTLSDSLGDGYTHPSASIDFGKLTNSSYALRLDEVRYSGETLEPFQFLQGVELPSQELAITSIVYDSTTPSATVFWNAVSGRRYSLDYSRDLETWLEVVEEEVAESDTMSYTDTELFESSGTLFYRVREIE